MPVLNKICSYNGLWLLNSALCTAKHVSGLCSCHTKCILGDGRRNQYVAPAKAST